MRPRLLLGTKPLHPGSVLCWGDRQYFLCTLRLTGALEEEEEGGKADRYPRVPGNFGHRQEAQRHAQGVQPSGLC